MASELSKLDHIFDVHLNGCIHEVICKCKICEEATVIPLNKEAFDIISKDLTEVPNLLPDRSLCRLLLYGLCRKCVGAGVEAIRNGEPMPIESPYAKVDRLLNELGIKARAGDYAAVASLHLEIFRVALNAIFYRPSVDVKQLAGRALVADQVKG